MQRKTLLVFLGAFAILVAVAATSAYVVWRIAKRAVVQTVFEPEEKTVDIATLVTQVRELNRLETASMRVMHVGTITQTYKMVPNKPNKVSIEDVYGRDHAFQVIEAAMAEVNNTAYVRMPFNVADPSLYGGLTLNLRYDDGFVAYLNGHRVASSHAPNIRKY